MVTLMALLSCERDTGLNGAVPVMHLVVFDTLRGIPEDLLEDGLERVQ